MSSSPLASFTVRRLTEADLAAYKQLRDSMLALHPEAFTSDAAAERTRTPESYRDRLGLGTKPSDDLALGAWRDDRLIGSVALERETRVKVRHTGHLVGMMVVAEARGAGVGQALLDACIAAARRLQGLQMLTLSVTAGNATAVGLYERAGFVRYGSLPRAIRVGEAWYAKELMVLTL